MTEKINLVDRYIRLYKSAAEAARAANAATGRKLETSRLGQMRAGSRTIPGNVQAHMMRQVLPWVLDDIGVRATAEQIELLADALTPPQVAAQQEPQQEAA